MNINVLILIKKSVIFILINLKELIMKKIVYFFCLIIIVFGCTDNNDNETPSQNNYLKVDNAIHAIDSGYLIKSWVVNTEGIYQYDLYLYTEKVEFITLNSQYDSVSGFGNIVGFQLFSSDKDGLNNDTYVYNKTKNTSTFSWSTYFIEYDLVNLTYKENSGINNGEMVVSHIDKLYTISFDCDAENGKQITGYFNGKLRYKERVDLGLKSYSNLTLIPFKY